MKKYLSKSYLITYLVLAIALFFMGLGVNFIQMACLGADPLTSLNLALSIKFNISVGTSLTICNLVFLLINLLFNRKYIGPCTIIFMLLIGPSANLWHSFIVKLIGYFPLLNSGNYLLRIILLTLSILIATTMVSFIIKSDLGTPPYDAISYLVVKIFKGKLSFKYARMSLDILFVITAFGLLSGTGRILEVIGIGTIINSFFVGPLLNFNIEKVATPILNKIRKIN